MTGTERKVLNKYYPPDFDPRKIPKCKVERNRQYVIRVMAPFNMRCNTCGEYIYKGKKFNARRETVEDDDFLGLSLFRFYIRCPGCLAEITFKTDLKNCDYSQEHGSTRLFEAEKLLQAQDREIQKQEEEDATNPMKMLEKRTKMSRFEMDALERLEELKEMNQRQGKTDYASLIREVTKEQALALKRQEDEDEAFVKSVFGDKDKKKFKRPATDDQSDDDEYDEDVKFEDMEPSTSKGDSSKVSESRAPKERDKPPVSAVKKSKLINQKTILSGIILKSTKAQLGSKTEPKKSPSEKEKRKFASTIVASTTPNSANETVSNGLSLLGNYEGSSDSADSD